MSTAPQPLSPAPPAAALPRHRWSWEAAAWLVAAAGVLFALFFRLTTHPAGASPDFVSIGFNARSLWRTGVDEYRVPHPLFFRSFGDWKNPFAVYSAAVSTALFGANLFGLRLPGLLFGIGMAALLWWCVRELTGRAVLARWLAVLSLLVPSAFLYVRSGNLEPTSFLFFIALAVAGVLAYAKRPTLLRAALAGILLGAATYAYTAGRLLMPLAVAVATASFLLDGATRRAVWPLPVAAAVMAVPMAVFMWRNPGALVARLDSMSVLGNGRTHAEAVSLFLDNYFRHFNPDYLFRSGQRQHLHVHNFETGFLSLWMWLPLAAVVPVLWERRHEPFLRFLAVLTLLSPIPGALTTDDVPHPNRWVFVVPLLVLLCAVSIAHWSSVTRPSRILVATLTAACLFEGVVTLRHYFVDYPELIERDNGGGFDDGMGATLQAAFAHRRSDLPIYLPEAFLWGDEILVGFWGDLDPGELRAGGHRAFHIFSTERDPAVDLPPGTIWVTGDGRAPPFPADLVASVDRHYTRGPPFWSVYRKR